MSLFFGDGLLRLIGATDATISLAHDYGVIIYIMMPLAMTQNTLASIIRADGSPRYAMGAIMLWYCWQLALLSFATVILTVLETKILSKKVRRFSRRRQMLLGQLNGYGRRDGSQFSRYCMILR